MYFFMFYMYYMYFYMYYMYCECIIYIVHAFDSSCLRVEAGEPAEALKYLRSMERASIKPNVLAWSSLLWACATKGDAKAPFRRVM